MSRARMTVACLVLLLPLAGCMTPLNRAALDGDTKTVLTLLDQGADVNETSFGVTPLCQAAFRGRLDTVRALLDRGAAVNAKCTLGWTPLYYAANYGDIRVVQLLLERGAVVTEANWDRHTPADLAEKYGHRAIAQLLRKAEAEELTAKQPASSAPLIAAVPPISTPPLPSKRPSDIDNPLFDATARIMGDNDVAIVIGVEKYQDLPASDYSASDAKLVKDYLTSLGVRERNIDLLVNERATQSGIKKAVESWLPNHVKKDSKVFIYYSGHGAPDPASGEAYLVPHDGDANYLSTTGYSLKALYDKLGALPAAEVMVVVDACFSGAGGRSVLAKGARPLVVMREGHVLSSNMAVLAAAEGAQISTSSPDKGHGILTYYFLKAIKDGKRDLAEIYGTIRPQVEDEAKLLNVTQTPSLNPDPSRLQGRFRLRK